MLEFQKNLLGHMVTWSLSFAPLRATASTRADERGDYLMARFRSKHTQGRAGAGGAPLSSTYMKSSMSMEA